MFSVKTHNAVSREVFLKDIYPLREPAVLKDVDIGCCCQKWTPEYLKEVGGDREVKIHVSPTPQMDFIHKNFAYRTLPFNELINRTSQEEQENFFFEKTEKYYLRSLGEGDVRKNRADISQDFPVLSRDITIPPFFDKQKFFSSVFRISSRKIQLWTHYDVMDNILIVVSGRKRVVLYPPSDALFLYLTGDKSQVLDIDNPDLNKFPEFAKATAYECFLEAGDILFIPAFWFHNVINEEGGVAVNAFWQHLDASAYDAKDPYGNKDLAVGARVLQSLDRALKILDELPQQYRDFYGRRMILRIQEKALSTDQAT